MPPGRPSSRTPDIEAKILEQLAGGYSLVAICQDPTMPERETVHRWMRNDADFATAVAQARARGASALVEQGLTIIDTVDPDAPTGQARIAKAKSQVEYRKWLASCYDRATFGDRSSHEVSGPGGGPVVLSLYDLMRQAEEKGGAK